MFRLCFSVKIEALDDSRFILSFYGSVSLTVSGVTVAFMKLFEIYVSDNSSL